MADTQASTDPGTRTDTVRSDRACLRCAYNLRDLPVDALCPECGTQVAATLRREGLEEISLTHRRRLRRGMTIAGCATSYMLLSIALARLLGRAIGPPHDAHLIVLAAVVTTSIQHVGLLSLTFREPRFTSDRPAAVTLAVTASITLVIAIIGVLLAGAGNTGRGLHWPALGIVTGAFVIASAASCPLISRIAHRLPESRTRAIAERLMTIWSVCIIPGGAMSVCGVPLLLGPPGLIVLGLGIVAWWVIYPAMLLLIAGKIASLNGLNATPH